MTEADYNKVVNLKNKIKDVENVIGFLSGRKEGILIGINQPNLDGEMVFRGFDLEQAEVKAVLDLYRKKHQELEKQFKEL